MLTATFKLVSKAIAYYWKRYGFTAFLALELAVGVAAFARCAIADPPQELSASQSEKVAEARRLTRDVARLYDEAKFATAIPLAQKALEIDKEAVGEKHPDYATDLYNLGECYRSIGDYARAEPLCREAFEIRKEVLGEKHPDYVSSLKNLAVLHTSKGAYALAEPLFRQALEIEKDTLGEKHLNFAEDLKNLAMVYRLMGDCERAEPLCRQALEINKDILGAKHVSFACSLESLAHLYVSMGSYARAERFYRQALDIKREALGEKHPSYATSLNNIAALYRVTGDYGRAKPLYHQALEIEKEVLGEEHPDYAVSLNDLAVLYETMGDYAGAEPLYRQALAIWKATVGEKHPNYATVLNNLAVMYKSMNDFARAEPLYRQASKIWKEVLGEKHPNYATNLDSLARLYVSMEDYGRAEALSRQALEIRKDVLGEKHPDYASSLDGRADLYVAMGDYAHAEPLYRQALEIRKLLVGEKHPDLASSLYRLAGVYRAMKDYSRAVPLRRQALSITRASLEATAPVQSERQQLAMAQGLRYQLDTYVSLGLEVDRCARHIFSEVLLWKGATLVRQRGMRLAADDPSVGELFRQLQQVVQKLASLTRAAADNVEQREVWQAQVSTLTNQKERLEAELAGKSAAFRQATREVTLDDLLAALPEDAVLVDFLEFECSTPPHEKGGKWNLERQLVAFVVRRAKKPEDEVAMISLGSVAPVSKAIDTWRTTFGMSAEGVAAGRLLRKTLWEPLLPAIGQAKTVLVSTDGVLGRLPLGALPGKKPGEYLLEDHRLMLLPVPQLLPALMGKVTATSADKGVLLVGNVNYDRGIENQPSRAAEPADTDPLLRSATHTGLALRTFNEHFGPLKETEGEIAIIERILRRMATEMHRPVPTVQSLSEAGATKARFRELAPQFKYIHVATHGFFADARFRSAEVASKNNAGDMLGGRAAGVGVSPGLLSGLAFAGANHQPEPGEEDGILTAEEIACLPLDGARLVTLSACDTGLGAVAGGEGLLGLQRAFQVSGARTTIASYWPVGDLATRVLMERFYRNLWEGRGQVSKLDALRDAQLYLLNHPEAIRGLDVPNEASTMRTSPQFWAAFGLSGDWR